MMRTFRSIAVCTVVAGFLNIAPASADQADVLRQVQDRADIEALMWRYVRALDTLDAEAYAAVFTADGQFGSGRTARHGAAELKQMITELKQGRATREAAGEPASPAMYHVITNDSIEFIDRDNARYESYWMTVFGAGGEGVPPRVAAAGRGIDLLVRVNGAWLIKSRNVAPE